MFKGRFFQTIKKLKLTEKRLMVETARREKFESLILSPLELEYVKILIQFDQIVNSHKHGSDGLYSEFDEDLNNVSYNVLEKLSKMKGMTK